MKIDLTKMFELQIALNKKIYDKHDIKVFDEIKNESHLALMAEIMELCNETRCFNYWSKKVRSADEVVLEEYADVLCFIFTQALVYEVPRLIEIKTIEATNDKKIITKMFLKLIDLYTKIKDKNSCYVFLVQLFELGFALGYNLEQIENAYTKKIEKNHNIQDDI